MGALPRLRADRAGKESANTICKERRSGEAERIPQFDILCGALRKPRWNPTRAWRAVDVRGSSRRLGLRTARRRRARARGEYNRRGGEPLDRARSDSGLTHEL